jgi:hypothetical protein
MSDSVLIIQDSSFVLVMGRLEKFIIYFFKVGTILGIFRFSYDKKTKCFVKSRFLEIYSVIVWTSVLFYMLYSIYIFINVLSSVTGSNENEAILIKINILGIYSTFYLSILAMFWCLFFGKASLLELANEGINLYRSVTIFKKYPRPSTDRFFWLQFVRNILVGLPMAFIVSLTFILVGKKSFTNIFRILFTFYTNIIYTCFLDLKNIAFFVAAHLLKLLRLELLTLNRKFEHNPKLRANELHRITKQIHKILNFLQKVDKHFSFYISATFLYFFIDLTMLVTIQS